MCISKQKTLWLAIFFVLIVATLSCSDPIPPWVQNLMAEDAPNDDGGGLIIKFDPMPVDFRILEYRIYRGITPDTLFYIGKVESDPKNVNVNAIITFSDNGYRPFVDVESPNRLRGEKGQAKNSPIYQALPRDIRLVAQLLTKFRTLAIISNNNFFSKSKMVIQDDELYAGLRIEDFETIYAKLRAGQKYYYSVVAVNNTRSYLQSSPIIEGIPLDNLPELPNNTHAIWIEDTQRLNIEFDLPLFTSDVGQYTFYMIPETQLSEHEKYTQYMQDYEAYTVQLALGDTTAVEPEEVQNPGQQIAVLTPTSNPISLCQVNYADGYLLNEADGSQIDFNPDRLETYLFYIGLADYGGFEAVTQPVTAKLVHSSQLPEMPSFIIRNKPESKGDTNEIIVGKPYAQITNFTFRGRNPETLKLQVAYNYSPSPLYNVKSITFDFLDSHNNDVRFLSTTEYFFDSVFKITLPSKRFKTEGFTVKITLNAPGTDIHQQELYQTVTFDEDISSLRPSHLYIDGEDTLVYKYLILRNSLGDPQFDMVNRTTPLLNVFDDTVPFEDTTYKTIAGFDLTKNLLLFNADVGIGEDSESGEYISTSLFLEEFKQLTQAKIDEYTQILSEDPENAEAENALSYYQSTLEMQTSNPLLADINKATSRRSRVGKLQDAIDYYNRTNSYKYIKTDERGMFVVSEVITDADGNEQFYPTPSWFKHTGWPMLIASVIFGGFVFFFYFATNKGKYTYIRPIAGLEEVDNAIGRATEMGRPILFVPGLTSIDDVATLAGLAILSHITKKAAEYDTRIIVPVSDYIVLPIAQQIVKEAHSAAGRPDSFNANDVFFVAYEQFAFVAGVNGIMIRQKTATNFYLGMFYAEALVMTETGNITGAIQIAGTDAITQIPFFITTCDYTLIGEELYAASAYLSRDPVIISTLKSQDATKLCIIVFVIIGTILSSLHVNAVINWFPAE